MPTKLKARSPGAAVAGKNGHSLISSEKFRQLYAALLKYELLEEQLGLTPAGNTDGARELAAGAVGITLDLEHDDTVVLTQRTFAANFVKGVPVRVLLDHRKSSSGNGATFTHGAVNALTPAGAGFVAQAGLATGAALANKMAKNRKIAAVFMEGDSAALKECREALELASKYRLPVVYVIQAKAGRKLEEVLEDIRGLVPVITVDAYDVVAVYRVAQESIARARDGAPTLIVCMPYALNGAKASALTNMEDYLTGKKLLRNQWKAEAIAEFNQDMGAACLPLADPLA
ncbi:MAG TPA: thiamine pyrophosphate-dependent enzyme [Silvibacterium sp.]|jgi:TPP-dependent pyruvate/acetoin dehydrogenase alpha subunit|nr:thiamine pyrophosphate-dependent enzyme [Silvibacterium sp.]